MPVSALLKFYTETPICAASAVRQIRKIKNQKEKSNFNFKLHFIIILNSIMLVISLHESLNCKYRGPTIVLSGEQRTPSASL